MPDSLTIRSAVFDDLESILTLLRDDVLGAARERDDNAAYVGAFREILTDPNADILLAIQHGAIVGCAQINLLANLSLQATKRAQIEGVRISSANRGDGLGHRFFALVEEHCYDKGCGLMQLTTNTSRTATLEFYRNIGFDVTHHGLKKRLT